METTSKTIPQSTADFALENLIHEVLWKDSRLADLEADNLVLREMVSEATAMLYQQTTRVERQSRTIQQLHEALRDRRELGRAA